MVVSRLECVFYLLARNSLQNKSYIEIRDPLMLNLVNYKRKGKYNQENEGLKEQILCH